MRYRFSLGRREAVAVLAGTAGVGVLLFCSGLLAGIAVADAGRPVAVEDGAYAAEPPVEEPAPGGDPAPAAEPPAAPTSAEETGGAAAVLPTWSDPATGEPAMGGPGDELTDGAEPVPGGGEREARPATEPDALWPVAGGEARPVEPAAAERRPPAPAARASRRPAPPPARDFERDPPRFSAYDGGGPYALQVGRYREEESALEVMQDLHRRGYQAYLFTKSDRQGPVFHVRLNRYFERAAAMRAAEALERREQLAALVVPAEQ
ncbi:MAG TPA: SPOR domain-containing protein [Longimicrobium sp.]|jgi:cell division septation protein DedD